MSFRTFDADDIVEGNVVQNVTSTAFSNNSGSITTFFTSSTQEDQTSGNYYLNTYTLDPSTDSTAEVQFSVAYGHYQGSGSARQSGASVGNSPTKAVYSQFRNLLLNENTDSTTFVDGEGNGHGRMFFLTINRSRFKQQVNPGNWELRLGSNAGTFVDGNHIKLIDDSSVSNGNTVNGHLVYNIVSGSESDGVFSDPSGNTDYWGLFYPELGILALAGNKIVTSTGPNSGPGLQLGYSDNANATDGMNGRLFRAIKSGSYFSLRSEEDVTSTHYFVRARNGEFNYSTNPTYQTGSNGALRHTSFIQNPQSFVTTVGLYNDNNELMAVAKLSKPLLKNFEREATIRVKLDY